MQFAAAITAYRHQRQGLAMPSEMQFEGELQQHIHQCRAIAYQPVYRRAVLELPAQFGVAVFQRPAQQGKRCSPLSEAALQGCDI